MNAIYRILFIVIGVLALAGLFFAAYRQLPERPFAADDYQWLLNVYGMEPNALLRKAFETGEQAHFYRPMVWLLFWGQSQAFDLNQRGYHAISLVLHGLNAILLGSLVYRLAPRLTQTSHSAAVWAGLLATAFVALHPAPFEAVVWVSAQSELLAAGLLLATLNLWLPGEQSNPASVSSILRMLLATVVLGLALLAKESSVIGLPLLVVIGSVPIARRVSLAARSLTYALPVLLTIVYLSVQAEIERRNYLLQNGGYGIGAQLLINPLRTLGLIIAPLPGTEHADSWWLVWAGGGLALVLLIWLFAGGIHSWRIGGLAALMLTMLPTAPFASPPDSRYLYLPVLAAAALLALAASRYLAAPEVRWQYAILAGSVILVVGMGWWASGELATREGRFAAGSGSGGSLWQRTTEVCAERKPGRVIVVEPPLAPPHAEAIVKLACGARMRVVIVARDQVAQALRSRSVVIGFENGSAVVQQVRD